MCNQDAWPKDKQQAVCFDDIHKTPATAKEFTELTGHEAEMNLVIDFANILEKKDDAALATMQGAMDDVRRSIIVALSHKHYIGPIPDFVDQGESHTRPMKPAA